MSHRWIERVLLLASVLFTGSAFLLLRRHADAASMAGAPLPVFLLSSPRPSGDSLESAAGVVARQNLFRLDRTEADPTSVSAPMMPTMTAPMMSRPRLQLRGILGGPPWDALVEGVPGRDGAVVLRVGQTMSGITLRAVRRDSAFASGFDTTWALSLRRVW